MDRTITGAASGENAYASPKDSQSQAKGQKIMERSFVVSFVF